MKQIYIVTGANGHLGNTVVRQLVDRGETVRAFVLPNDKTNSLNGVACDVYQGDVCDINSLQDIFDIPCDAVGIVIHCAGIVSIATKFIQKVYDVNVIGTRNISDMCIKRNISKLIHVSSVHAIPENKFGGTIKEVTAFSPELVEGLYAKTKAEATNYVLNMCKLGLNASVVHPSGIIGPNDYGRGHLTQLIIDYLNGTLTACVDGGYDFVDVRDVADGILNAVEYSKKGECYILSNKFVSVMDLLHKLSEITGKKPVKTVLPMWFANLTAPLAELYYKIISQPPLYTKYSLYTLYSESNFCNDKAREELNYTNRPIEETLKDTAKWLIDNGRVKQSKIQSINIK